MGLKKQIIQLKDGKQVAVYDSATSAAEAIGSTKSNISKCCTGKLKQVNGYTFEYSGEFTNKNECVGEYKCPYCEKRFKTYNGLTKHVIRFKEHGNNVTQEKLLTDFKYGGDRPKCKCGCGGYTDISYVGGAHFCDYVSGHQSRVHNNWGHNKIAQQHSTDTRRKQYLSGERIQWNKGTKWSDTFSDEEINELMKIYLDKQRNKKISEKLKGVPKSEEHAEKCRQNGRCENSIIKNREKIHKMLTSGEFSLSSEIEKRFIEECIESLGVDYNKQYYIKDIRHYCDVYVPSKNTIIEFQGDYWHGNPKKYLREELSSYQLEKVEKDEILRKYCKDNNINLIEVWESDYNRDSSSIKEILKEALL